MLLNSPGVQADAATNVQVSIVYWDIQLNLYPEMEEHHYFQTEDVSTEVDTPRSLKAHWLTTAKTTVIGAPFE